MAKPHSIEFVKKYHSKKAHNKRTAYRTPSRIFNKKLNSKEKPKFFKKRKNKKS